MDYKSVIENLISGFDIKSELGSKKAYTKCIDYANENFKAPKDFNSFIAEAAKMLDQMPYKKDVVAETVPTSGDEKLHLSYSKEVGPVLTGNKSGLSYLAGLVGKLAVLEDAGEHTHLRYGEFPMYGKTFSLTIYLEDDSWFIKHANKTPDTEKAVPIKRKQRDLNPNTVIAFAIFDYAPPTLPVIKGNIYKVKSCVKYKDQKVWVKGISDESDRLYVFEFDDDSGVSNQFALDLDDPTVLFLTKNDIRKLGQ
jgi:hypothetical protein